MNMWPTRGWCLGLAVVVAFLGWSDVVSAKPKQRKASKSKQRKASKSKHRKGSKSKHRKASKSKRFSPRTRAERIVEKMVAAMGGRANLALVRTMMARGTTKLVTPLGERAGKLVTYSLKPSYQRVDMTIAQQKITQSFYPGGGWLRQGRAVLPMPRSMLSVAQAESLRSDLELRYFKIGVKVILAGERKVQKQPCYVIHFVDKRKRTTIYAIARKTWLPLERSYVGPSPLGGGKMRFTTHQNDFRWVQLPKSRRKIRVPFYIENFMNNRKIGSIQLTQVKLNPKNIIPAFFRPPNPTE